MQTLIKSLPLRYFITGQKLKKYLLFIYDSWQDKFNEIDKIVQRVRIRDMSIVNYIVSSKSTKT